MPKTRKRLDLNTCTVDELESVDGVTRSLAKGIVAYRNRAGYFNNISELGKVRGVGDRMLSLISEHVYILPSSPRSRRSSVASSRANSPRRGRSRISASRVSFSRSPSPIRRKSPKRDVLPQRRSERVLSRSSVSQRSSRTSPSRRSSPRHVSPKRQASKQNRSTKKNSKSRSRSGPVFVDSAQNVSIDLGKLAKEGCNLTLHGGASDGQLCHLMTINVKELDGPCPSVGLSIPTPGRAFTEQHRSSSPARPTRTSSIVGENVREYLVIRETKRTTENFSEEPGIAEELPTAMKFPGLSQKRISPRKVQKNRNRSGDNRKRSRSRSRTLSRSVSRSPSPKKGSLRRSRSGSRQNSPPRSRRRNKSAANERLSRSDIENWLQEGSAPLRTDRGEANIPLASSTPRRKLDKRDKRERRSPSPASKRRDVAGPSRIEDDGRNEPVVLNRAGNARGQRRHDTKVIDQGIQTTDRGRSRSRGRRSSNRPVEDDVEGGDELVRRHRSREPRHRSKTDRDSHRRRRHEETVSYAMGSWCSIA